MSTPITTGFTPVDLENPTMPTTNDSPALWSHLAMALAWLDAANPRTDHEVAMRVLKVSEEIGEAAAAYIGMTGQNPRKGITHTREDLAGELCDVVMSALVALATLTGDADTAQTAMDEHLTRRTPRLHALIHAATAPTAKEI